jgi:glycosyltransferase involved in cell wall biosynthesis
VREAKAAGVQVWLRGESNDLAPAAWWKKPIKRALLGRFFNRVDRFLYIGSANRRLYQKFGVPDQKLFPAPYAVDNERFRRQANELRAKRQELRAQWSIPEDSFCVLFCGKFIPKKRPADLIAAVKLLQSKQSGKGQEQSGSVAPSPLPLRPLHLLFAGSGELGADLRSNCEVVFDAESGQQDDKTTGQQPVVGGPVVSGRSPKASFTGFLNQTEISPAYVAADVLVLPSDYTETWGLVVNEAMASGLPCIVSDRCGCAEDLMPKELTFKAGDVDVLANTIQRFRENSVTAQSSFPLPSFATTIDTVAQLFAQLSGD